MTDWKDRLRYIPLKGKVPVTKGWCYDDASLVRNPSMNEGIPTGRGAGIFVLDVDPKHGGDVCLRELEQKHGPLPETYMVETPSSGTHRYFKYSAPEGCTIPNSAGKIAPGIDIRGDGGQVVAPGSKIDGKAYVELTPDTEPAEAPAWLQRVILGLSSAGRKSEKRQPSDANGKIPNGQRNDALTRQAGKLRNMNLSEAGLVQALLDYARQNFEELDSNTEPDIREMAARAIADWDAPPAPVELSRSRPWHEFTSLELSDRFATAASSKILYAVDDQAWFDYVDGVWVENKAGASRQVSQHLRGELPAEPTDGDEKLHRAWKRLKEKLWGKRITGEVEYFARTQPQLGTLREHFDRNEWVIGLPDGNALDLRTGEVRGATPEDRLAQRLNVIPADRADESTCPNWLRYLATTQPNENIRSFLKRFFGYALTASDIEQVFLFFLGIAGSGKGTMLYPITKIMGPYFVAIGLPLLAIKTDEDRRNNYLADLVGKRLATVGDMPFTQILDANILKTITGGDAKLTARRLGHQPFAFTPYFKIVILSNTAPNLSGVDGGIKRRVLVVPFQQDFTTQPDTQLREKLTGELPGILRWMVEGCLEWRQTGLCPPAEIRARTDEYIADADTFEAFLQDVSVVDPNGFAPTAMMFAKWAEAAKKSNYPIGTERAFAEMVRAKRPKCELDRVRYMGSKNPMRGFKGLRLLESEFSVGRYQHERRTSSVSSAKPEDKA
jgi:putative DNA primase/helicase